MRDLQTVQGQGQNAEVSADDLDLLQTFVAEIRTDISQQVVGARTTNDDVRFARWAGQSPDGRKRDKVLGRPAVPFDGASDVRQRTADQVIQERVRLIKAATKLVSPEASAMEDGDNGRAARITIYLKWLTKNKWGSQYGQTIELLAQYREGDTPAVSLAFVDWYEEECLEYREVTRADVTAAIMQGMADQGMPVDDAAVFGINDLVTNPLRADDLAAALPELLSVALKSAAAKKLAGQIIEDGGGRFPAPYTKISEPQIIPLRLYEDVFYPHNTPRNLQRARIIIMRSWLSKAEVLERQATEGWSEAFVTGLLGVDGAGGHEGKSGFDDEDSATSVNPHLVANTDPRKGLFEVLTSYRRAANEDGVLGIFVETFSAFVDVAAKPRELWDRKHGMYPFIAFPRECLTSRLNDSRGWSELLSTQQNSLKLLSDSFEDHVQATINPPVKKPRGRPFFRVTLAPFGEVEEDRPDSIKFMERPSYPTAADKFWVEKRREVNEYAGRFDPATQPNQALSDLAQQDCVDSFLASLCDCFQMVVQLAWQFESDERLARITGGEDEPIDRSKEEIQGKFDIQMHCDVRDLDLDKVIKKTSLVVENLQGLDRDGRLPYNDVIQDAIAALNPNWARHMPTVEQAGARVLDEERGYFVQILSGVDTPKPDKIDAADARAQALQGLMQPRLVNPNAFPPLSPAAVELYNSRLKYLQFQAQQVENAATGRKGVQPVDLEMVGREGVTA